MAHPSHQHEDDPAPAPPKLVAALRRLYARPVAVPPRVDRAVLAEARRQLRSPARNVLRLADWRPWLAAAATGVLALTLAYAWLTWRAKEAVAREDLDGNGRVDILDAFALARRIQHDGLPPAGFDLNGDGVVDQKDVEVLATHAVEVPKAHPS